ncbi:hypothetical protein AQUCO_03200036v1 [Aquilegia coerulea]|uniref:Uncharacterized protein n=1 Tax=Aquilegia coerulea TaxID=218851 RepID=A0A2G5CZS8_AQUCA|nr:hypothetical protein AQUCO_03200036v1 [Aquilegia coerulea]
MLCGSGYAGGSDNFGVAAGCSDNFASGPPSGEGGYYGGSTGCHLVAACSTQVSKLEVLFLEDMDKVMLYEGTSIMPMMHLNSSRFC